MKVSRITHAKFVYTDYFYIMIDFSSLILYKKMLQEYFFIYRAIKRILCVKHIFLYEMNIVSTQLLVFTTAQYNINLLLKILSFVFPTLFGTIKYVLFIIQADNVSTIR